MFAGILSIEQPLSAWGEPARIANALAPYSTDKPRDFWHTERQMLLQVATRTGSTTAELYRHPESGVAVAFWGRLDNRPDLISQLEAHHNASDDELIALAWLKWGAYCPEQLVGDFAFAVASPKTGTVFLARDVMGVKPLFYRADAHGVFFANSAAAFKPLQLGSLTPSSEWMARYIMEIAYSHTDTAFHEVKKLAGAQGLLIHADGRMDLRRYHRFVDDSPPEKTRDPKYLEAYQVVWQESVACRIPATGMIGTENSGGLDSGSITAELARQLGDARHRLFGFGFAADVFESEYIMEIARHCKLANTFLAAADGEEPPEGWFERELRIAGYPHEHPNASSHAPFYHECRLHGIGTLFSGFGGDEVVTLNGMALRRELFDCKDWRNLWDILPGAIPFRAGRFGMAVWRGMQPVADINPLYKQQVDTNWPDSLITREVQEQFSLYQASLAFFALFTQFQTVNQHAGFWLQHPLAATRMGNCTLSASALGIDYVWPLCDQRLIQQWLATPAIWKMGPAGITRYLHRRAVAPVGPDKMVWKANKDMGNAAILALYEAQDNRPLFEKLLELCRSLPTELERVIDRDKALHLAQTGIKKQLRGARYSCFLDAEVSNLSHLMDWLKHHQR